MRTLHYSSTEMETDSTGLWYAKSAVRFNGLIAGQLTAGKSPITQSLSMSALWIRPRPLCSIDLSSADPTGTR